MGHRSFVLAAALFAAACTHLGNPSPELEKEKPAWVEVKSELPPYPKPENLIAFQVSPADPNRYFVDAASISVGRDGVVRYTVVIKSPAGAQNVLFEGIRCDTRSRKLYAFGHRDGTWSKPRDSEWKPIEALRQSQYQRMLYSDFFCPGGIIVKSPAEAISALKAGIHPRAAVIGN